MKWTSSAFKKDTVELTLEDIGKLISGEEITDGACSVKLSKSSEVNVSLTLGARSYLVKINEE